LVNVVEDQVVPRQYPEQEFTLASVTYSGICRADKRLKGKRIKPEVMFRISKGDLLFSNIRATDGGVGIVPAERRGLGFH